MIKKAEEKKLTVIEKSAKLFYFNGYINTGLNEILEVCNIPKGSFYYYFKNKEDLLIHVIDYHVENINNLFDSVVNDLSIFKLKAFFSQYLNAIMLNDFHGGSPLGNLTAELSDINDNIRLKLNEANKKLELKVNIFFTILSQTKPKYYSKNLDKYSNLILTQLEGICLQLKRTRDSNLINNFMFFFDIILERIIKDDKNEK